MDNIRDLFKQILEDIREDFNDNSRIETSEENGCFSFKLVTAPDNNIKNKIANYKKNLDLLDDCIFVDVLDELTYYRIDLKYFDGLLNKEQLTESEETYVSYLIDFTNSLIRQHILDRIQNLNELLDNF